MDRRRNLRLLRQAFRIAGTDKIVFAYVVLFLVSAILIWLAEPSVPRFLDGLWYCFAVATTVGFGDFAAATHLGRIVTVILSFYSIGQNYPASEWCAAEQARIALPKLRYAALWNLIPAHAASRISGCHGVMNVFRMMLHGKATFLGFMLALNGRMSRKTALPAKEKERLILFVTCRLGCTYVSAPGRLPPILRKRPT